MNGNKIRFMAGAAAGLAIVVFMAAVWGFKGATIEGAALLLIAFFVGYGVSHFDYKGHLMKSDFSALTNTPAFFGGSLSSTRRKGGEK